MIKTSITTRVTTPDYKRIYADILYKKFPEKAKEILPLLQKRSFSAIEILELNEKIFGILNTEHLADNQKLRSYRKSDILKILDYQKKNKLSNCKVANHFRMSRNTIAKWKKLFL